MKKNQTNVPMIHCTTIWVTGTPPLSGQDGAAGRGTALDTWSPKIARLRVSWRVEIRARKHPLEHRNLTLMTLGRARAPQTLGRYYRPAVRLGIRKHQDRPISPDRFITQQAGFRIGK